MTKAELIDQMAGDAGISKTEAAKALDSLLENIGKAMKGKGGKIALPGLGTFSKVVRQARKGVNPATGEKITIKAHNAVKFKPGKALKDAVA
jgi:DNA-binding protein HU-beta